MSKEEIEQLPAGRELDALIAEKVMGHQWYHDGYEFCLFGPNWQLGEGWIVCPAPVTRVVHEALRHTPNFSTDIKAAWQVVEHLNKTHYLSLNQYWITGGSKGGVLGYRVLFNRFQTYEEREESKADTPAHAICLAAILTIHE